MLGSSSIARVIVPAAMNGARFCGSRGVLALLAVWLGNRILLAGCPPGNGAMSTGPMVGLPAMGPGAMPCAMTVVPCGIDAIRATVKGSFGFVVVGTATQMPGSKWMPVLGCVVMSVIDCR